MADTLTALLERLAITDRRYRELIAADEMGRFVTAAQKAWAASERDRAIGAVLAAAKLDNTEGAEDADDHAAEDRGQRS